MSGERKTAIVTGGSQGIGAGLVKAFLERGYNVVANSRKITKSGAFEASDEVALVDGNIAEPATAARIVETALSRFKSIDALVNNAGIFFTKQFTDYTVEDFKSLVSTNVEGFLYVTQLSIKQMLAQKTGGSIVTITASLARNPIRGVTAAVPMITKGGLETITQHLAIEYAKDGIRVNAVAPGAVYTPLHRDTPKDVMESLSPMGRPSTVKDITDAVMYLTDAATVTGDILYVDGGAHVGAELDVEAGRKAAHLAALNVLAVARQHLGSLDKVTRIVRLGVYVATSGDIRDQPRIADAASELLQDVFGKEKNPSRLVYGVASLPLGTPVELEIVFEVAR